MKLLLVLSHLLVLLHHVQADKKFVPTTDKYTLAPKVLSTTTTKTSSSTTSSSTTTSTSTTEDSTIEESTSEEDIADAIKRFTEQKEVLQKEHPECFNGDLRSPINLEIQNAVLTSYPSLKFTGLDEVIENLVIKDDNFTEIITSEDHNGFNVTLSSGGLNNTYYLREIQWRSTDFNIVPLNSFSHSVNGGNHAAEIHFVFTRKDYTIKSKQISEGDVVNVAVFVHSSHFYSNDTTADVHFDEPIIKHNNESGSYSFTVPLRKLFPSDLSSFFRYKGSMVRPPCRQGVLWNVLTKPIRVPYMNFMRYVLTPIMAHKKKEMEFFIDMVNDFPLIGNRVVYLNKQTTEENVVVDNVVTEKIELEHGWLLNVLLMIALMFVVVGSTLFIKLSQPKVVMSFDNIAME